MKLTPDLVTRSDIQPILVDLLAGDESVYSLLTEQDVDAVREALQILKADTSLSPERQLFFSTESWRLTYRVKPPTPEEFLTEAWIGPQADSIFPHNRRIFCEYFQPNSPYRSLILGMAIGAGKSTLSTLVNLYITTHLWCMRDPKRYFKQAQSAAIVQALISFTMDKAAQTLLQPFIQILSSSPKFRRVKLEESFARKQKENPDQICWTTAGRMGVLQFPNDVHYILASNPAQILGLNMISSTMSEISFFIERGYSPAYIWRMFQDSKGRIRSRFEGRFLSTLILDSSPNDMEESPIDRYIFTGEAAKDPSNLVVTGAQWEFLPGKYKVWQKTGETFPVFRGSGNEPPRMLHVTEVENYPKDEVYNVPIDIKVLFEENCAKSVKDYCGWPAGNQDKLIRESSIIERMFTPQLRNVYTFILAPSTSRSEGLLWDIVRDKFFVEYAPGRYEFYRAPREKRYLHVDQAESKDMASIVMTHPEWNEDTKEIVWVHDFTLAISPGKGRINLNAIRLFPEDLQMKGRIQIDWITTDRYQSSTTIGYWKEKGFSVDVLSVDVDIKPYYNYISLANTGRIRCGRNIFLKNNLKSLQEVKTATGKKKVDHTIGLLVQSGDEGWTSSFMGQNAKDVSDSCAGSVYKGCTEYKGVPRYRWVDDTEEVKTEAQEGAPVEVVNEVAIRTANKALEDHLFRKFGVRPMVVGQK